MKYPICKQCECIELKASNESKVLQNRLISVLNPSIIIEKKDLPTKVNKSFDNAISFIENKNDIEPIVEYSKDHFTFSATFGNVTFTKEVKEAIRAVERDIIFISDDAINIIFKE